MCISPKKTKTVTPIQILGERFLSFDIAQLVKLNYLAYRQDDWRLAVSGGCYLGITWQAD